MSADVVGARQAERAVVQLVAIECAVLGRAFALGVIDVEVEHQALFVRDRQCPVDVGVVFAPVVFNLRVVQAGAEVVGEGVGTTYHVGFLQAEAVAVGLLLGGQAGEMTSVQGQALDLVAGDQGALGNFRQQAAVVGGEDRQSGELVTHFQHGVGDAEFNRAAGFGVVILRTAVRAGREQAGTGAALAAVQFQAEHADGIDTHTHGALGEAGLEGAEEAQAGFFTTALGAGWVVTEVTAEVQHAGLDVQLAVFDETFGLVLGRGQCQLRGPCRNGQGDHAPLHHAHRDLLLWFLGRVPLRPSVLVIWGSSFLLCRRKCIAR